MSINAWNRLKPVPPQEIPYLHPLLSFQLQNFNGQPAVSGLEMQVGFAICTELAGSVAFFKIDDLGFEDFTGKTIDCCPCGGVGGESTDEIMNLRCGLLPVYFTGFTEDLGCGTDFNRFVLRLLRIVARFNCLNRFYDQLRTFFHESLV